MLDHSTSRARRHRDRRYRQRQREGRMAISVEIDAGVLDFLIKTQWLREHEVEDRRAIGYAIGALLKASVEGQ